MSGTERDSSCHGKASALGRCRHVAALLLCMSKYAWQRAPQCTDLPSQWTKGKKKTPDTINKTSCKSYTAQTTSVITFDPCPYGSYVSSPQINMLLSSLAIANTRTICSSMWETVLQMPYEDYDLTTDQQAVLASLTSQLEHHQTTVTSVSSARCLTR